MKIFLLVFSFAFISIGQTQSAKKALFKAYKKKSSESLDAFFTKWQTEIQPITDSEFLLLNDTIRNAYEVYVEFFNWKTKDSVRYNYVLVQNSIQVHFSKKVYFSEADIDSMILVNIQADNSLDSVSKQRDLTKNNGKFSNLVRELYSPDLRIISNPVFTKIDMNFRPELKTAKKVLFLNAGYTSLLDEFLNSGSDQERKPFLENYLEIQLDYFIKKWEFVPYTLSTVTFDEKMEYVRVDYGIGEVVYMKRENGQWKFVSHELLFLR